MTSIIEAVSNANLKDLNVILAEELPTDLCLFNSAGQTIIDIAIANHHPMILAKLISGLEGKKGQPLQKLLLRKNPDLALMAAAKLKDPQIFELLIKQPVGYSIEDLELIEAQRLKILQSERDYGKISALLKSACPSKSLADMLKLPETIAGISFAIATGSLALFSLLGAILALTGLCLITYVNYNKLKIEQDIENERLKKAILWAKIKNFEKKLEGSHESSREVLLKELNRLKPSLKTIHSLSSYDKRNNQDFLTQKDKQFAGISLFGEALCSNAGLLGLASFVLTFTTLSMGLSLLVYGIAILAAIGISTFYYKNFQQYTKEVAQQRRTQVDTGQRLYKSLKSFRHKIVQIFPSELDLVEQTKANINHSNLAVHDNTKEAQDNIFRLGDRRALKTYFANTIMHTDAPREKGKTLLHIAVENNHPLLIEDMLGISMAAKARKDKLLWNNFFNEKTHRTQYLRFEALQKKRKGIFENYQRFHQSTKTMLLTRDATHHLPLYYAAHLKDPSIYHMLLEQPVEYEKADLDAALKQRLTRINKEKWWALASALIESICPGDSISEISSSIVFISLVAGATFLNPIIGITSILIYGLVSWSNYYMAKYERGIHTETEKIASQLAYFKGIKLKLEKEEGNLNNTAGLGQEIRKIQSLPIISKQSVNLSNFITMTDYLRAFGSSLGAFLCAYAGTLGIFELATNATTLIVSGATLSISGPIGWVFLGIGAMIGLAFAAFYFVNRRHEIQQIAEIRRNNYQKKEVLVDLTNHLQILVLARTMPAVSLPEIKSPTLSRQAEEKSTSISPHP